MHALGDVNIQYPNAISWTADDRQLAVSTYEGWQLVDAATLTILHAEEVPQQTFSVALDAPQGIYAVTSHQTDLGLYDMHTDALLTTITPGYYIAGYSFSPDGSRLVSLSGDTFQIDLWDTQGKPIKSLSGFDTAAPVYAAAIAADESTIVYIARATIQLQDISSGKMGIRLEHEDFITAWALSPDGRTLVTSAVATINGEPQPELYFLDAGNGKQTHMEPISMPAASLSFSPDGSLLAAAVQNDILLIDPASGGTLTTLSGHTDSVAVVQFSPDGTRLASTGFDNTLRIWGVSP
jgi:WD40 repeat protein